MQPPPLTQLRAEAVDWMLSKPLSTVVPRAPASCFIIFRYVIHNGLFSGSPFSITSNPTFSLLEQCLKRQSAPWKHTLPLAFSAVYLATGDPLWGVADQPRHGQAVAKECVEVQPETVYGSLPPCCPEAGLGFPWPLPGQYVDPGGTGLFQDQLEGEHWADPAAAQTTHWLGAWPL